MPITTLTKKELIEMLQASPMPDDSPVLLGFGFEVPDVDPTAALAVLGDEIPVKKVTKLFAVKEVRNASDVPEDKENNVYLLSTFEGGFYGEGAHEISKDPGEKTFEQLLLEA